MLQKRIPCSHKRPSHTNHTCQKNLTCTMCPSSCILMMLRSVFQCRCVVTEIVCRGSLLAYGDEDHHTEMRVRIIFEMVQNSDLYLSDDFLASGTDLQNLVKTYISYSGQAFSINVTEEDMKKLFQNEVMNCRCPGAYMSMWGIHGLSSVLGVPVQSVYPQYGGFNVRKDLHRVVQPRICRQSEINTSQESLPTIMWTSCLGKDKPASTWVPNHFVVCVPYF